MARFGVAFGAEHATFQGLAGMGDLITTCISPHGRNRRVGYRLGKGEKLADILASSPMVAEGVYDGAQRLGTNAADGPRHAGDDRRLSGAVRSQVTI